MGASGLIELLFLRDYYGFVKRAANFTRSGENRSVGYSNSRTDCTGTWGNSQIERGDEAEYF